MARIVEVKKFNNDDYKKWLVMTGKKDSKEAMVEYCATILGQGKECWEALQKGEITIDNIELAKMSNDIPDSLEQDLARISDREVQGFKRMFEGIAQIVGIKEFDMLDEVDEKSIRLIFMDVMADYGKQIMETGSKIVHMCEIYSRVQGLLNAILGGKKEKEEEEVVQ